MIARQAQEQAQAAIENKKDFIMTINKDITIKEQLKTIKNAFGAAWCCGCIGFIVAGFYDYQGAIYFSLPHAINFGALMACVGALVVIWDRLTRDPDAE